MPRGRWELKGKSGRMFQPYSTVFVQKCITQTCQRRRLLLASTYGAGEICKATSASPRTALPFRLQPPRHAAPLRRGLLITLWNVLRFTAPTLHYVQPKDGPTSPRRCGQRQLFAARKWLDVCVRARRHTHPPALTPTHPCMVSCPWSWRGRSAVFVKLKGF